MILPLRIILVNKINYLSTAAFTQAAAISRRNYQKNKIYTSCAQYHNLKFIFRRYFKPILKIFFSHKLLKSGELKKQVSNVKHTVLHSFKNKKVFD